MKLIVCLGNPGRDYEKTRHNAGFIVGSHIVSTWTSPVSRHQAIVYSGYLGSQRTLVIFPQTFMNLSGKSVRMVATFYKIPVGDICVVYDDFDIPIGTLRFRAKGSAGTHNGMKSIVAELGSTEFPRLRVGIGPKIGPESVADFVLASFLPKELVFMERLGGPVAEILTLWASGDQDAAVRNAASYQEIPGGA